MREKLQEKAPKEGHSAKTAWIYGLPYSYLILDLLVRRKGQKELPYAMPLLR